MRLLFLTFLLIAFNVQATDGEAVERWWATEYKQNIAPQQSYGHRNRIDIQCQEDIRKYEYQLQQNPNDEYARFQLKILYKKCG